MRQQARTALTRYDKAVLDAGGTQSFVPVGELTDQLGDWEPANGDNNKQALLAGRVSPPQRCPPPGKRRGRWSGRTAGRSRAVLEVQQGMPVPLTITG
ncbi:hypothetical protein JNW88_21460 [Micromonospora sp. ATA32]|nr:hypothetical protein [Micromonospora sp. ATA32]